MNDTAAMQRECVIGIDAGGTGVRIAFADSAGGDILFDRETPADPDGGPQPLFAALQAIDALGPPPRIVSVCAGITKVSRDGVVAAWEDALRRAFPYATRSVVPDYVTAFHGGLLGGVGVVVAAGTGSVVYGENAIGGSVRLGGHGWEYGDEGSGAWLTAEVVRRAVRACDGLQPATALTDAVCEFLGARDAGPLAAAARRRAAESGRGFLTPLTLDLARANDPDAANMFTGAAAWLALLTRTAVGKLDLPTDTPIPIATTGGLWEAADLILDPFTRLLHRHVPNAAVAPAVGPPLRGAIRLALRAATNLFATGERQVPLL